MCVEIESIAKTRILLVEDSSVEAKTAKHSLERAGYDVEWVKDGKTAIKIAKTKPIDVILLDLVLPDISGREVCRYLRKSRNTNGIPIIMLTVRDKVIDRVAGLAAGADDYLPKPYSDRELNARIYACLRTKELRDGLQEKNKQLAEMFEEAKKLATTDPLTGLFNRRHCEAVIEYEFRRAARYKSPLSCFILDIDHFKTVNDKYGHRAGDTVLVEIAQILKGVIRAVDTVARWGGEEFLLVLPQTGNEGAMVLAQKLLNKVSGHTFSEVPDRRLTVSIGIAGIPSLSIDTGEKLVNAADRAMYKAKRRGRNMAMNVQEGMR
ncbi:MAG: diguanylate cyclase [Nitrospirae bacterium]|nr:diguanylate cyclase [Nitrospirota bacterium]